VVLRAAAVVAGMRSFTAIAGWIADVPAELYGRRDERIGSPSKVTIWWILTGADAAVVDAAIGAWLAERSVETLRPETARCNAGDDVALVLIAVDGKTVRGGTDTEGNQVHLLAAVTQGCPGSGQVQVDAKSNEIPMFAPLLETTLASPLAPSPSLSPE